MSDRGIWGLSAESTLLHSYQLQRSPSEACTHRGRSPSPTVHHHLAHILTCTKAGNLSNTSVPVSTIVNLWEYWLHVPFVCLCPSATLLSAVHSLTRGECRCELRLTSARGRRNVGLCWRNVGAYQNQMTADREPPCVNLCFQPLHPHIISIAVQHLYLFAFKLIVENTLWVDMVLLGWWFQQRITIPSNSNHGSSINK